MNSALIKDATPQVLNLGAQDLSTRTVPVAPQPIPQHLPLIHTFTQKGPTSRELIDSTGLSNQYGLPSFDINGKFYTHQTRFLLTSAGLGNVNMVHRMKPLDAGDPANVTVYACISENQTGNDYVRNNDGSYMYDSMGNPVISSTINNITNIGFIKEYSGVLPVNTTPNVSTYLNQLHNQNSKVASKGALTASSWSKYSNLPSDSAGQYGINKLSSSAVFETKSKVYIFGGYNWDDDGNTDQVFSAIKNADGTIGDFVLEFNSGVFISGHNITVTNNTIIIIGGDGNVNATGLALSLTGKEVLTMSIDNLGNLIPESLDTTTALPSFDCPYNATPAFVVGNNLYVYDCGGAAVANLYSTTIKADGSIGSWTTTNLISHGLTPNADTTPTYGAYVYVSDIQPLTTKINGYKVYIIGGGTNSGNSSNSILQLNFYTDQYGSIYLATGSLDGSPTNFNPTEHLSALTIDATDNTVGLESAVGYATKDAIHLFGGYSNRSNYNTYANDLLADRATYLGCAYTIPLDANQDLIINSTTNKVQMSTDYTSEMLRIYCASLFVTSNSVYIVGGNGSGSTFYGTVTSATTSINDDSNTILVANIQDGWNISTNYYGYLPAATTPSSLGTRAVKVLDGSGECPPVFAYPIFEFTAAEHGEYYNNLGFSIVPTPAANIDQAAMAANSSVTYDLSIWSRPDGNTSPSVVKTLDGDANVTFSFKNKVINPNTNIRYDMENMFGNNYYNTTDTNLPYVPFEISPVYVYHDNIELLLNKFVKTEMDYIDNNNIGYYDFTGTDSTTILNEKYLMDMLGLETTKGAPYVTLQPFPFGLPTCGLSPFQQEVSFSTNTPVFLGGGTDGTTTAAMLDTLVQLEMVKYADPNSEYMDTAVNVESILYDSGFNPPTKKALASFIMNRKDTALVLSTHYHTLGNKSNNLTDTRAIATMLKSYLNLSPESVYFGTPVARAIIVGGDMMLRDGSTDERIPLTYEILYKSSIMMGASDGKWKRTYLFDNANNGSIITQGIDIQPAYIPNGVKPALWFSGLVWAQNYDRTQYFFPAIQTVYPDDTSVLNSYFNIMVLCTLNKIGEAAWRQFSGTTSLSNSQFIDQVTAYVNKELLDLFAGIVTVVPEVVITAEDALRGYSWQLVNKMYANNMKTSMVYSTQVYRASDLTTTTTN